MFRKTEGSYDLVLLRHKFGGHWSFPKGHVEAGETEVETALREVREETGLTIELKPGFREQVAYSPRPGVAKEVVYFLGYAEDSRTVRQEEEISEIRWVNLRSIGGYLTYDNDRLLIKNARRYLRKNGIFSSPAEQQTGARQ